MTEEIEQLCGRISLSDREKEGISISDGDTAVLREKGSRCLVGRIGSERRINRAAFRALLTRIWRPLGVYFFRKSRSTCGSLNFLMGKISGAFWKAGPGCLIAL
ncbi:hypothetical protein SLA2020_267610 [Shorea laevis]